jgi:uncharacterized membrane protein YhfC
MSNSLTAVALLGGTGMILVALGFIVYAAKRRSGWGYMGLGALAWVVTVAVKIVWSLPVNPRLYPALTGAFPGGIGSGLFDLYVGLLTGLTEVAMVWLVLRYTRLGRVGWERALAFGIGFGALEALLLGLSSFITALVAILSPHIIPAEALAQIAVMNNPLYGLAPIVERFFTIWVHILANVLIFFSIARMQARWFWLAFWYKSLIDLVAGYAQICGILATIEGIWTIEAIVVLFGVVGWWGVGWAKRRYALPTGIERPKEHAVGDLATVATLLLMYVLTAIGAFALVSQEKTLVGIERDAVLAYSEPMTDNLMSGLNANDYAVFSRDLNDKMKAAMPETALPNLQDKVMHVIGRNRSRQVNRVERSSGFVTVVYDAQFDNEDQVTMRVSFEAAAPHAISGLWFDSAKLRQR